MSEKGLYTGVTDVDLSPQGRAQARRWSAALEEVSAPVVISSPLRRALQTCEESGITPTEVCADLREWDLGALEGHVAADYRLAHPRWSLFRDGPPDASGERPAAVQSRADAVIHRVRAEVAAGHPLVIVGHGQFLKVVAARLVGLTVTEAGAFGLGPARAGLISLREHGLAFTGWNLSAPSHRGGLFDSLT